MALTGEGVPELVDKLKEHRDYLEQNPGSKRTLLKSIAEAELVESIKEKTAISIIEDLRNEGKLDDLLRRILKKEMDPASAAQKLLNEKLRKH